MADTRTEIVRATQAPEPGSQRPLSGLDQVNRSLTIRGTWVFDAEIDTDRLKDSLARVLVLYPHLAGRAAGRAAVDLSNQGVPFTTTGRPDLTVRDVCDSPSRAGELSVPLSPRRVGRGLDAPLTVALTRLRDGCVLGVRVSHTWLDGHGFYGMVRTWSCIHGERPFEPPVLDPSLVPQPTSRSRAETIRAATDAGWRRLSRLGLLAILPAFVTGRLHQRAAAIPFRPEGLERLRRAARRDAGREDLTINDALSAHLTRMCVALHGIPAGTACAQVTVVDLRGRFPSIPAGYAGNASFVIRTAEFAAGASLGEIAERTHDALARAFSGSPPGLTGDVVLAQDLLRHRVMMVPFDVTAVHRRRPTIVYVNNFARLPIYDVDFGDRGRPVMPVRVIPHDLPDPVLIWPAPPAVGGLEVYLTGRMAHAVRRRASDDPWWSDLRQSD